MRQNAGWDKMATIWGITFSNASSWMKTAVFSFKCHWSLFLRVQLIKSHHGWGNGKVTNRWKAINLNLWPSSMVHKSITRPQWVEMFSYISCWLLYISTLQRCQMSVSFYWSIECLLNSSFWFTTKEHERSALPFLCKGNPLDSLHKGTATWKYFHFMTS